MPPLRHPLEPARIWTSFRAHICVMGQLFLAACGADSSAGSLNQSANGAEISGAGAVGAQRVGDPRSGEGSSRSDAVVGDASGMVTTAAGTSSAQAGRDARAGAPTAGIVATAPGSSTSAGSESAAGASASAGSAASGANAGAGASDPGSPAGAFAESSDADCGSSPGEMKQNPKLPDPFMMHDGTQITTQAQWRCRRSEIRQDIQKYEIGPKPEPPTVEASYAGGKLSVLVKTQAGSITLSSTVTAATGSDCVAIGMNRPSSLVNGCVQVPFMHDQVVKYVMDSAQLESDPFYTVYPELWKKIGNYAAWSWGISRLIDGLVQLKNELQIDPAKIAVHGCSYAGKMALFAGAFDERIALTVAQESGGGGINAWRTSQDFTTRTGTNIEKIDNTSGSWFLPSMKQLDPYSLPHDHHELVAMVAPRAVIALGNQDYEWLGDESGWRSINAAKEVWTALGAEDHIGFDFTSDHSHCAAAPSQVAAVDAFVDRFLKGKSADTAIVVQPDKGNLDLDFESSIDWQTPKLQ